VDRSETVQRDEAGAAAGGSGVRVADVAYVRFRAPDLDAVESFFADFGLQRSERTDDTLYLRGTDDEGFIHVTHRAPEPGFVGFAFAAESETDLETLRAFGGFSDIEDLDGPGGGRVIRTTDPSGFEVEVVADRAPVGRLDGFTPQLHNEATAQPRRGRPLRLDAGPSHVKRLGHVVLNVADFRASEAWYKERFGLLTSDEIALDEDRTLGAFLRCDRGARYVDHHTLFLVGGGRPGFNHAAFEVADIDDLMTGHTHLTGRGRIHNWGIGRHLLGSQVYDYWVDPFGNVVEHWTDGDLFDNTTPPGRLGVAELMSSQWGPTHTAP
jgi:catechol 2,3-dioxygenase-like lactoylglutathione lyase family enzyme